MDKISKTKYLLYSAAICLILIFNLLWWKNPTLGLTFTILYFLFVSFIFGSIFIPQKGVQIIYGFLFLFAAIAIFGGLAIYLYQFNDFILIFFLILTPAVLFLPYYRTGLREKFFLKIIIKKYLDKFDERREPKINSLLVIIYLIFAAAGFYLLSRGQTIESIQSPWQTVSSLFFPLYFLATFILLIYLFRSRRTKLPLTLIIIHFFLSGSAALIIYQLGYGFDPFIHQATEKIIFNTGIIQPKPLYYLGQYAIVVYLSKLTLINLDIFDKVLVPILFSIFIPLTIFYAFSFWLKKNYALVLAALFLIIPYGGFIMTAPQNLANLIFIVTILFSLLYFRNQISPIALYLLAGAALIIHPLAGIPLLITIALLQLFKTLYESYHKNLILYVLASLVFALFIPLALLANGSLINFSLPNLKFSDFKIFGFINRFDLPLDLVYLVLLNKILIGITFILVGVNYLKKHKLLKNNAAYLTAAGIIFIDYLLIKYFFIFSILRENDKNTFVNRLFTLAFYIMLPIFLVGLHYLIKKFWSKNFIFKFFLITILAGGLTVSLYLSYPRLNQYEPAKFFSVSASDFNAVSLIEKISGPNHIVLANQMVGAAAIKEFGFKKYYDNQFYYSMPMGEKQTFYDYFLEMIYQGARKETMQKAMKEAGVNEAYFVLNRYWNNSERISKMANLSADEIFNIDNGQIWIFRYQID